MDYLLCSGLLTKYNDNKIRELIHLYTESDKNLKECHQIIERLDEQILILQAENRFLKELNA